MEGDKISILMPVFNGEFFLKEAIDSVIQQTFINWELIIINDGSNDNTENIIKQYTDRRIRYFKNETNLGLIDTLNKGIDLCNGVFIVRMDADDIALPNRLAKQYYFLKNNSNIALLGSNALLINNDGEINGKIINFTTNELIKIHLLFSVPFIHPSVIIRSEILKELRYDNQYKHAEDYDLWCRIADNYSVANESDFLLKYRWHTTNVSVLNSKEQDTVKKKIIQRELKKKLNISPSEEELFLHSITFIQYDAKSINEIKTFKDYDKLNIWFNKIIEANSKTKKYDKNWLISYLWSRWIVLCIKQKKYTEIMRSRFVPINFRIYIRTIKIVYTLWKKS